MAATAALVHQAREDQKRREEISDKLDDDLAGLAVDAVMTSEDRIEQFTVTLDTYDHAIVIALMENQEALDSVNDQIDRLLDRAHVMADGRRVFKAEDGTQVFDEFGQEDPL